MLSVEEKTAVMAAKEAGKVALRYFGKNFYVKKKGKVDLATQADFECEKKIHEIIGKSFPHDSFLEEESGKTIGRTDRLWVVDPIDGTINFAHAIPWFATSIALVQDGEVVLGVVFDPVSKKLFTAKKGKGAFLNGRRIRVSKTTRLVDAVVSTGFPYERGLLAKKTIQSISSLIEDVQGIRRFGAAVLDFSFVACGFFDGFFEYKNFPWDVAAGKLLVEEAGGKVTRFDGKKAGIFDEAFVASNSLIHSALLRRLEKP